MGIATFKRQFDPSIKTLLDVKERDVRRDLHDPFLLDAVTHIRRLLLAGGKRIRPYVAELAYRSAGGKDLTASRRLFRSLELFHLFCLIHDDVIDHGGTRHGLPTTHVFLERTLNKKKRIGDRRHIAMSQAILVGDLAYAWAYETFDAEFKRSFSRARNVRTLFDRMVQEVIIGQMIDVDLMTRDRVPTSLIRKKIILKTARYTFVRPMQIGAALCGKNSRLESFFDRFGTALGMAFQIQDDLLDLTSSSSATQKTVLSDLRDRQHTLFTQHIVERGTAGERAELKRWFGREIPRSEHAHVLELFRSSGAIQAGTREMNRAFDAAEKLLYSSSFLRSERKSWEELIRIIRERVS
jgi:geranylgeranyl diphosphate synthase type I